MKAEAYAWELAGLDLYRMHGRRVIPNLMP